MDVSSSIVYTRPSRLTCRHGFHLRVTEDTVEGSKDEDDTYIALEMQSVGVAEVMFRGKTSGKYIAMSGKGLLFTENSPSPECVFREIFGSQYNSYESKSYPGWYLALTKRGVAKTGPKTALRQKSTKFLTRYIMCD